jgi:pimeloyl-ACP methyl ester carboxylesterase
LVIPALLQGCARFRSTEGPINSVEDRLQCRVQPKTLIVFLPGAYDTPKDLIEQGFVSAVRARKIHADIQLVDAHTGYYTSQQILQRLDAEVIEPARSKGYSRIWFVGISLGGYGSLLYSMKHPTQVDGFFVMAPYMGPRDIASEIQQQGGLKSWSSPAQTNVNIELWRWLQGYGNAQEPKRPQAWLGYGATDRFAHPNGLMAEVLPAARTLVIPGGHDWATWRQLWSNFLDVAPWPRATPDSGCTGA